MSAIDQLISIHETLRSGRGDGSVDMLLATALNVKRPIDAFVRVMTLFDEASEELIQICVDSESTAEQLEVLHEMKLNFASLGPNPKLVDARNKMTSGNYVNLLKMVRSAVRIVHTGAPLPIDRTDFVGRTVDLIEFLNAADIEEVTKKNLAAALDMVNKLAVSDLQYSDQALRKRVNQIVAEFMILHRHIDKDYQTLRDRIVHWAGYTVKPGLLLLGVSADSIGLLEYWSDVDADEVGSDA